MCPKETVAAITALAAVLVEKLTPEEGAFLAALFTQLGDTMESLLAGNELCCKNCKKDR
ncbi:MAG: DUF6774 domain-containing protein [Oscillospiraceae bacterium]